MPPDLRLHLEWAVRRPEAWVGDGYSGGWEREQRRVCHGVSCHYQDERVGTRSGHVPSVMMFPPSALPLFSKPGPILPQRRVDPTFDAALGVPSMFQKSAVVRVVGWGAGMGAGQSIVN